jgi:hypothetical protein
MDKEKALWDRIQYLEKRVAELEAELDKMKKETWKKEYKAATGRIKPCLMPDWCGDADTYCVNCR